MQRRMTVISESYIDYTLIMKAHDPYAHMEQPVKSVVRLVNPQRRWHRSKGRLVLCTAQQL